VSRGQGRRQRRQKEDKEEEEEEEEQEEASVVMSPVRLRLALFFGWGSAA